MAKKIKKSRRLSSAKKLERQRPLGKVNLGDFQVTKPVDQPSVPILSGSTAPSKP